MATTTTSTLYQSATLAICNGQICMVTSSSGKRWVIPKGCHELGKSSGEIALQEAWEEAGLVGQLQREPIGTYIYAKWGSLCHVTVFLLRVTEEAEDWPERGIRQRMWLKPRQALERMDDEGLRKLTYQWLKAERRKARR